MKCTRKSFIVQNRVREPKINVYRSRQRNTNNMECGLPEVRADGSEHISVTGEGLAIVHLQDDVGQLRFVIQGFKLLENGAGVQGVYPVVACACRSPILYL